MEYQGYNYDKELEHRKVWKKFYGDIPKGFVIHHKNGNKKDNRIENLELLKRADHTRLHNIDNPMWTKRKIDIELMKKLYYENGLKLKEVAEYFGFKSATPIRERLLDMGLEPRKKLGRKKGFKHSEETKRKMSISMREKNI